MNYKSGFTLLDKKLNGFSTGEMIVFGARPGHGNIYFMLSVLRGIHNNSKKKPKIMIMTNKEEGKFPVNKGDKKIFDLVYDHSTDTKSFFDQLYKVIELSKPDIVAFDINSLHFNRNKEFYRTMKIVAMHHDVMVVINSNLRRKVEERADKRPMISDLETSPVAEEIADKVILMYRPEVYGHLDCSGREQKGLADTLIISNDKTHHDIYLNFDEEK
nr:DnaB-like helicase C-terminal domain-containing protein [Clostridiales bacterium]